MKQFLSIILRNQFNLFYRFGYTFIPKCQLVEFEGNINNEIQESIIKQFQTVTPFEYDQEYLILHLEKETTNETEFIQFEIQNVVAIYPLSQQAKASIELIIDQRIRLEKPIFETLLPLIESEIENKEVEKAISALWKICKIENPVEKYIENIGLENIFNGLEFRKHGTKSNKIQNGNYWEYLIAYDRFDYFPNSTLGYFYDAGQVFAYSKGHPTFEGSGIHQFLEKLNSANPTAKLPDIIKYLETEEQLKGYVSQTTTSGIKQYIVAPLYLMLRDEIRKSDDISQTKLLKNLDYLKKIGDSFNYTVILLGAFFGFRRFYDNYYDALNLRFYKSHKILKEVTVTEDIKEVVLTSSINGIVENTTTRKITDKTEEITDFDNQDIEIKSEKILENQIQQIEKENNKSDISDQIQNIIEKILIKQVEIKYVDICKIIYKETEQNTSKNIVIKIIEQMNGIEKVKIGNVKSPNGIRLKERTRTLFNE